MFLPLKFYFWPKKSPCGNAHTDKIVENVKNVSKWVEIQQKNNSTTNLHENDMRNPKQILPDVKTSVFESFLSDLGPI